MNDKEKEHKQRTTLQNKSIHAWFNLMSKELKSCGVTFQTFLAMNPTLDIYWPPELVKKVWKEIQFAMYGTNNTTMLSTKQIDEVYDVANKMFAEITGVHVPFPSNEPPLLEEI